MKRFALLLVLMFLVTACTSEHSHDHSHPADIDIKLSDNQTLFKGRFVQEPFVLPSGSFTDTSGQSVTWPADDMPADVTVVFFGLTNCSDGYCTTQTANIAAAIRGLKPEQQERVNFIFITTDPPRDTPEVLRTYLDLHNQKFIGLIGDIKTVQEAGLSLGVHVDDLPDPLPTGDYEVGHGLQLFAFLKDKTSPLFWMEDNTVQEIRSDIRTLLRGTWQE